MPHSVLEELVGTAHLAERRLAVVVESAELTPTQYGVLSCLDVTVELSHSELARALNVRRQGISRLVDEMIARGQIELTGPRGRGRRNGLRITAAGASALSQARPAVAYANRPSSIGLTAEERDTLTRLLVRVRDHLDDDELS